MIGEMMANAVVGIGRLGLPLLLNFQKQTGSDWLGYDINANYVALLNNGSFSSHEPHVDSLLNQTNCRFTSDASDLKTCRAIFLCVRTDSEEDGQYDVSNVFDFVKTLTDNLDEGKHAIEWLVINCNVNPGTSDKVQNMLRPFGINVCFWPEWVKQGEIVKDQTNPPVHVLGFGDDTENKDWIIDLILSIDLNSSDTPKHIMSFVEAEVTKITLNCYLTVKISYANMIGRFAEQLGLNGRKILQAVGEDPRIGNLFFKPGDAYGGPCFPRDTKALISFGKKFGHDFPLVEAASTVNEQMMFDAKVEKFREARETRVAKFEHLDFKKGTYIFSGSPNLIYAQFLNDLGVEIELDSEFANQIEIVNDKAASE